jgi:hypothetical protein
MTPHEHVEQIPQFVVVLAAIVALAVIIIAALVARVRWSQRHYRAAQYELRRLRELVGTYERIDQIQESTIHELWRATGRR